MFGTVLGDGIWKLMTQPGLALWFEFKTSTHPHHPQSRSRLMYFKTLGPQLSLGSLESF